jgi:predicted ester cyclase
LFPFFIFHICSSPFSGSFIFLAIINPVSEGDRVVAQWSATGIHAKSFLGEPPTQKKVKLKGIGIYQIKDGKIYKDWVEPDNLDFLTQLGILEFVDFTKKKD